jgi:hypothetical protein
MASALRISRFAADDLIERPRAALLMAIIGLLARLTTGGWASRVGVVRRSPRCNARR